MTEVVLAHESEAIREVMRRLCVEAGYAVEEVGDGHAALAALARGPAALVLDVALPEVHAYEIVEEARRRAPAVRIVLVASVYSRTAYKRKPTSLYGADDYIEQHHIPDSLVDKLERLIGPAPVHPPPHAHHEEERAVQQAGEGRLDGSEPDPLHRAVRLARLIVADIALYNGDALLDATGGLPGTRLHQDLEEGRALFDRRIAAELRQGRDFIAEALDELRQRRET